MKQKKIQEETHNRQTFKNFNKIEEEIQTRTLL